MKKQIIECESAILADLNHLRKLIKVTAVIKNYQAVSNTDKALKDIEE